MTVLGLDISNHQGEISVARAQGWAAAGIQHVVVRASLERQSFIDLARRQMQACKDAGLSISGYGWYYQSVDPARWALDTLDAYGDMGLVRVWLDCEETSDIGTPAQVVAWIHWWLAQFHANDVPTGIYTGAWWWGPYTNHSTAFASEPLWHSQYDGVIDLNIGITYGGWTHPYAGKQYADDGIIGGMKLDLDLFSDEVVQGGDVTDAQMAEVQRIAEQEIVRNIEKALAVKRLPAAAQEALRFGALPAAQTLARGEV